MFSFLDKKPTSYLGVDLGTGSVKLVELESVDGRPRLVTYGMVEIETNVANEDSKTDRAKVASVLRSLIERTGARSRVAVAALPNFSVFSSVISLPKLDEKKLAEAVTWEAKKFVPMPIENVVLDWKILEETKAPEEGSTETPEGENATKKEQEDKTEDKNEALKEQRLAKCKAVVKVLLTAAPKHLVERYVTIFNMAGLDLLSLETESFALSRSLVGNDPSAALLVDVGSITTDLTLVENRIPVLARSIDVGGKTITKAIADTLGVSPERAEQFKRDVGISSGSGEAGNEDGIAKIINQSFGPVVNEMKYTLDLSKGSSKGRVEKILLTGGSSFLPSLAQYLTDSLQIKTFVSNAWARVSYPKDLQASLEQIGPRMSVAIGLAMREIE